MSYTKQYLIEKLEQQKINEIGLSTIGSVGKAFFGDAPPASMLMQGTALAGMAAPAVVGGYYAFSGAIRNLFNNFRYRKKNCELVLDPAKKEVCLNVQRKQLISSLIREKSKCQKAKNPQQCMQTLDNHINKLRNQEMQSRMGE